MVTRTGLQVVTDALKLIGVVAGHEVPTSAEQQDSLARLQELIDSWGTHAQTLLAFRRWTLPLVPGRQTYSIGLGAPLPGLAVPRPMAVEAATTLIALGPPAVEARLEVYFDQAYVSEMIKDLRGPVQAVYYLPTVPFGTLWVWPVPLAVDTLVLYWHEPLQQFPDLTTPVDLAPGYAKALRTNLALELAPEFGRAVDPAVMKMASDSLADLKRQNFALVEVGIDPGLTGAGAGYDILSDS
jgi:hypothetical protein